MITVLFGYANEKVLVRILGNSIYFSSTAFGAQEATIGGLKIDKAGAIKEHPDLEEDKDWKDKTIERFKKKVASLPTEDATADYVIDELTKWGYTAEQLQRKGSRPVRLK